MPQQIAQHACRAASRQQVQARPQKSATKSSSVEQMLDTVPGGRAYSSLQKADAAWHQLCEAPHTPVMPPKQVIREVPSLRPLKAGVQGFDVVVLGGTLGIFQAAALALRGVQVAVIERNKVVGREQEWNIGRKEMKVFVELGLITAAEMEEAIVSEFNPVRVALHGSPEIVTTDVLNCGVYPVRLLESVKQRFLGAGGTLLEGLGFQEATVHPDGVALQFATPKQPNAAAGGAGGEGSELRVATQQPSSRAQVTLHARLVVDAMGSFSPIAAQARGGVKPDSVVLMVGSCSQGLPPCSTADLLYSFTPIDIQRKVQWFWEVFPARDGLTTYMFSYVDPATGRLSLEEAYSEYLRLLPQYRECRDLAGVQLQRAFFGFVPNWIDSPLEPCTSRLLHIGDSAGNRSALSFAGFGAIARHLRRLTNSVTTALELDDLSRHSMALLQPHSPAISITAAMQQTMGTRAWQNFDTVNPSLINNYIGGSFGEMQQMGEEVYKPFLQDVMQAGSLSRIVVNQILKSPGNIIAITLFMDSPAASSLLGRSFAGIVTYNMLYSIANAFRPAVELLLRRNPRSLWRFHRTLEKWEYGSARDYKP